MITLEVAKNLHHREILHAGGMTGRCTRWRVNGKVKTWKRSPEKLRIPVKHGLYSYDTIFEHDLPLLHLESECGQETRAER